MHECPICGCACDCDGDDTWLDAPDDCECELRCAEEGEEQDDGYDYWEDYGEDD